ncbi:MAG: hypothetical protein HRT47_06835 [Candidatus Caenarcaniphilales bacterium]|nr:hypothetical protein [Candidatus Caenarcaniphilales bacterium]
MDFELSELEIDQEKILFGVVDFVKTPTYNNYVFPYHDFTNFFVKYNMLLNNLNRGDLYS